MNSTLPETPDLSTFTGNIGVSHGDISPPTGIYMGNWGASTSPVSTGNHHGLSMTCLTIQSDPDGDPLVMIGMDLGWWKDSSDETIFRNSLLQKFDLEPHQLLIFLSHTHSGPSICRMDSDKPGGHLISPYLTFLEEKAIELIHSALQNAETCSLVWNYGYCDLAKNRDLPDPASDRYLVGYHPDAESDHTLLCGLITNEKGEKKAVIANYACHPTTLGWENTLVSPDFPGMMKKTIWDRIQVPVLFMQGASGDLAPIINYTGNLQTADRYGRQLGYAILSTLEAMTGPGKKFTYTGAVESGAPLAIWKNSRANFTNKMHTSHTTVRYEIKDFPSYQELEQKWINCSDSVLKERLWRKMGIRKAIGDGSETEMDLWIWRLGDAYIVAQPNEAYAVFQRELRVGFPGMPIAVSNLVNGSYGYLPPKALYSKNIYAVWQTPFAKGSLERLLDQSCKIIQKLENQ